MARVSLLRYNRLDSRYEGRDEGSANSYIRAVKLDGMRTGPGGRTNKLRRLLISLGITLPIALAPLLVKLPIPLLSPVFAMVPLSTRSVVVPLLAVAAILVTVFEEVDNKERISTRIKVARFRLSLVYGSVSLILFVFTYAKVVTRVEIPGGTPISYITGWPDAPSAPCAGMGPAECIAKPLLFHESSITAHFGERRIQIATYALEGLYILFFLSLGLSIARLLEMKEATRPTFGDRRSVAQRS
jgi:hypothetical protein